MLKTVTYRDCIGAGRLLGTLLHSLEDSNATLDFASIVKAATALKAFFNAYGFNHAVAVGANLWTITRHLETLSAERDSQLQAFNNARQVLWGCLDGIKRALDEEANQRQLIELKTGDVSKMLRDLPTTLPTLTDAQKHLLDETTLCLECEAYRSAAVMGWNLAYDYIRQWVFTDQKRLADFNAELTKNPKYATISKYEDFYDQKEPPGEFRVIECCEQANLFGGKIADEIRHYLRQRNRYAHPNNRMPTMHTTNAYIDTLIQLITAAPFK